MHFARFLIAAALLLIPAPLHAREMESFPVVKLQSLDKVTARTMTFEANVGNTVKFGSLYIKIQACSKAPPVEQPESAAFLQIWEVKSKANDETNSVNVKDQPPKEEAQWIFSGWMFASSPALSHMDHPIYDVWVLDCLQAKGAKPAEAPKATEEGPVADEPAPAPTAVEAAPMDETPATDAPTSEGAPAPEGVQSEELSPLGD
jgi:hypothetical protein